MSIKVTPTEHDPLFATGPGGLMHVPERGEAGEFVIDPITQKIYLLNVLSIFSQGARLEGLAIAASDESNTARLEDDFGGAGIDTVKAIVRARRIKLGRQARYEFARAYGMFDLIYEQPEAEREIKAQTRAAFDDFVEQYAYIRNARERDGYHRQLEHDIEQLQAAVTAEHLQTGSRPHQKDAELPDDGGLDSRGRLLAITADARASFLPTTHTEKTTVMAYLDYLDNPEYRLGVRNQTLEIGRFHRKKAAELGTDWQIGKEYGVQAAWSRTYELGDFLFDATRSLQFLKQLQEQLYEPINPRLSLTQAIGPEHAAYPVLTRYRDLAAYRDTGSLPAGLPHHPLHPHRNETASELELYVRKNKVLEDPYTRSDIEVEFVTRIADLPDELTVRDARGLVNAAVEDAERRARFMRARLQEFAIPSGERTLKPAGEAASFVLAQHAELVEVAMAA